MASTSKSEKLALNLWVETDRPQRADFNSDNMIIDEALGAHLESTDLHLTETEKARVSSPVVTTGYAGDGAQTRTITLPTSALAVMVYCAGMPLCAYDEALSCTRSYSAICAYGAGNTAGVSLSGNTLTVTQQSSAENGAICCLNESGKQYRVVVIR